MLPAGKVTLSPCGTSTASQSRSSLKGSLLRLYMRLLYPPWCVQRLRCGMFSLFRSPQGVPPHPLLLVVLLVVGVFVFVGAWLAVATAFDSRVGGMAVL